jgi:glutathione S-transferase
MGTAPVLEIQRENTENPTATTVIAESGAIVEYLMTKHGANSPLAVNPDGENYASYLYWFHAANASLQPQITQNLSFAQMQLPSDNPMQQHAAARLASILKHMDDQLSRTKAYLAGPNLTAADIMTVFSLTTMRYWYSYDLIDYPNIVAYLQRVGERKAYRAAIKKGDKDMVPLLDARGPEKTMFEILGGWKKD